MLRAHLNSAVLFVLFAVLSAVLAESAQAQDPPAECASAREERFYDLGFRKGGSLARQAIARLGDADVICEDIEAIEDLQDIITDIVDALVLPDAPSQAAQCHVLGQIDGLIAEVVDLQEECTDACITDGEFVGEVSALLYCELSIACDGLALDELFERLATTICGELFQDACDATFEDIATGDAECEPFTEGEFEEVFLEAQNNQCAENPADPLWTEA